MFTYIYIYVYIYIYIKMYVNGCMYIKAREFQTQFLHYM